MKTSSRSAGRRRLSKVLVVFLAAAALAAFTHTTWLAWAGGFLVKADEPAKADLVFVLAGDHAGLRALKGAELARAGLAGKVLLSSTPACYGYHEGELAIPFLVRRGYPREWFEELRHLSHSTREEATAGVAEFRRRGAKKILVVTSNYHSRRASGSFRAEAGGDPEILVVAAPDRYFNPESWWKTRESQKILLLEYTKLAAYLFGL